MPNIDDCLFSSSASQGCIFIVIPRQVRRSDDLGVHNRSHVNFDPLRIEMCIYCSKNPSTYPFLFDEMTKFEACCLIGRGPTPRSVSTNLSVASLS